MCKFIPILRYAFLLSALFVGLVEAASAQNSSAQVALEQASQQNQYSFLVFYKADDAATQKMGSALSDALTQHPNAAAPVFVQVTDSTEQAIVERFDVARAPMPLTVSVAPNGAVTGLFARRLTAADVAKAFVTPTMANCMKATQEQKLVVVCVHSDANTPEPAAVADFVADPAFQDRTVVFSMLASDPEESLFLKQMKLDPSQMPAALAVVIAPPGVLIGKFDDQATAAEIAAAVHKAGKCCDDPNCKHNRQPQAKRPPAARSR
jgi:hypothetical protein